MNEVQHPLLDVWDTSGKGNHKEDHGRVTRGITKKVWEVNIRGKEGKVDEEEEVMAR